MTAQEIEQRITFEALAPHFEKMRDWAVFTTLIPLTVVVVMWSQVNRVILISWLALVLLGIGARYLLTNSYQAHRVSVTSAAPWHLRLLMLSTYLGILWSIAIFAFFSEASAPHQIFLTTLAVTLGIGSTAAGTHWLPLYYLYGIPIMVALILRLALVGTLPYIALALMMTAALLASFSFARKLNSIVRSEMHLHLESEDLAQKLQLRSEELQEAIRAKSRILATASHDLRQPLHALSLFIDALKGSLSAEENRRIFQRIDISLSAMRKLFDALFDISRLDANVVQPELSHFDIRSCLADLTDEYQDRAAKKNLRLRLCARSITVLSDRALLERILRNLISNALRYTRSGGVLIAARQRRGKALIQVWDTGVGIPPESQERAFIEFQQLQAVDDERDKGLGFGLAIVRRLCELLDYPLRLHSEVGHGSVFSIEVPAGDSRLVRLPVREPRGGSWQANGQSILVVDDDINVLNAMETLLAKWQFRVITAGSLAGCLEKLTGLDMAPDLILSDLSLRGQENGIEVIAQLRSHFGAQVPGILITGATSSEKLKQVEESGLKLVQKPVRPSELRSIIQHHLLSAGVS